MSATPRHRMAAATLLASFDGPDVPEWLLGWVDRGLGGVCLFASNLNGRPADTTRRLHAARPDVVVATDEEGGDVTRLWANVGSPVPGNAALGAVDDPALTRQLAGALGASLAAAGIDLDLAPVADVNVDAANPAIGVRSFGGDAELVGRHVAAFVDGLQEGGVGACVKHFPGHGATVVDSHLALPVVDAPADVIARRELIPFRAAIEAGTAAVMTGHLVVPALDDRPGTLSHRLLGRLLRTELGFDGAIVTDALDMAGIGGPARIPTTAVEALAAGADLCCLGPRATDELVAACVEAIVDAVERGELAEARLADAAARVAGLGARRRRAGHRSPGDPQSIDRIGLDAARRAIRTVGDPELPASGAHVIELVRPAMIAAGTVPWGLGAALSALDPAVTVERVEPGLSVDIEPSLARAAGRPLVVAYRDAHRYPTVDRRLEALAAARPDAVLVDLGWPHPDPPSARGRVTAFGAAPPCTRAAAEFLIGRLAAATRSDTTGDQTHG